MKNMKTVLMSIILSMGLTMASTSCSNEYEGYVKFENEGYPFTFYYDETFNVDHYPSDMGDLISVNIDGGNYIDSSYAVFDESQTEEDIDSLIEDGYAGMHEDFPTWGYSFVEEGTLDIKGERVYYTDYVGEAGEKYTRRSWSTGHTLYDVIFVCEKENEEVFKKSLDSLEYEW